MSGVKDGQMYYRNILKLGRDHGSAICDVSDTGSEFQCMIMMMKIHMMKCCYDEQTCNHSTPPGTQGVDSHKTYWRLTHAVV